MKRKLLLSLIYFFFILNFAYSQDAQMGVTLNIGFSKFPLEHSSNKETKFTKSGNFGIFFEKKKSRINSFGIGFLWVQLEGMERSFASSISQSRYFETRTHLGYFGMPIYHRIKTKKLAFQYGIQGLILLARSENYHVYRAFPNQKPNFTSTSNKPTFEGNDFDFGPKIGFDYEMKGNFRLKADFFIGLLNKDTGKITTKKNSQQFTIGLSTFFEP